jgi:hypothetical protein
MLLAPCATAGFSVPCWKSHFLCLHCCITTYFFQGAQPMRNVATVVFAATLVFTFFTPGAYSGALMNDGEKAEVMVQPKTNMQEELVGAYTLPDPLATAGGVVRKATAWQSRRSELLSLFQNHVYGRAPGRPGEQNFKLIDSDPNALDGKATLKRIAIQGRQAGREHQFTVTLFLPNDKQGPVPVFLLLNHRNSSTINRAGQKDPAASAADYIVSRGYGVAEIQTSELAPDSRTGFTDGVISLFEDETAAQRPSNAWGAIAAWAWGASRTLDYLRTVPEIDAKRIAIVGHSRGGKAALWAGALDQRFAMVVANDSGEGGAALARRNFGETIALINQSFPHWFADAYKQYSGREEALPVDQHMLLSLIAPRPLYISSATEDRWADPRGEFLSLAHASPVYALWNEKPIGSEDMPPPDQPLIVGRRGYHIRTGNHDLKLYDWARFLDFADKVWKKPVSRTR